MHVFTAQAEYCIFSTLLVCLVPVHSQPFFSMLFQCSFFFCNDTAFIWYAFFYFIFLLCWNNNISCHIGNYNVFEFHFLTRKYKLCLQKISYTYLYILCLCEIEDYTEDIATFANSWSVQTPDNTKCIPVPSDFPNPCSSGMPAFEVNLMWSFWPRYI